MSHSFIRTLWGVRDDTHRLLARRRLIDLEIERIYTCQYGQPFKTYIFGEENYNKLKDRFDCVLVDKNPTPYDPIKYMYRNKMELIKIAMQDYDEIVYMDWDCVPIKALPNDFWTEQSKKKSIQGCLETYHRIKCWWRKDMRRTVINGGYLYIRDKNIPDMAIACWNKWQQDNDEPGWMRMIDEIEGGWKGIEYFWDNYETPYCNLYRKSAFGDRIKTKDNCFTHYL